MLRVSSWLFGAAGVAGAAALAASIAALTFAGGQDPSLGGTSLVSVWQPAAAAIVVTLAAAVALLGMGARGADL